MTVSSESYSPKSVGTPGQTRPNNMLGVGFFAIAVLSAIGVFWAGIVSLADAWSTPEYSHGPLIPVLSFYLFLRQLKGVPPITAPIHDRWPGVGLMAFALLIGMIGNIAHIPDIATYALILWLYGMLLITFGFRHGLQFWPPIVHLIYMLPLPAFLYWQVSIKLQFISSELGVYLINLMDIPVFLDGNIIDLGVYKLHVAEACSGLRYLFPVMSFSYIFAVLYQGPMWHKAVLLISAAPITIVMNSFRIGMIGILVDSYGIEQAEGFLHFFEGWVVFILCVLILFGLARLMQKLAGDKRPLAAALDLDFTGIGPQFARVMSIRPSAAMFTGAMLTLGLAMAWHLAPERAAANVTREPLVLFPRKIDAWAAGPLRQLDPGIARVLNADDYYAASFTNPDERMPVDFFIAYYDKQTEGSGIHSPEVCIPAGGWEMSQIIQRSIPVEMSQGNTVQVPVNRAIIQKGLLRQLVYYWFEQRGRRLTSDYVAKAVTVYDAMVRGRTDGALVRVITPIGPNESDQDADARLASFLASSLPVLGQYIPE